MKFAYKRYTVDSDTSVGERELHRPMVPLRVIGPAGSVFVWALLDTGADETLLPLSIRDTLGVEIADTCGWSVTGIGGQSLPVVSGGVTFRITDGSESLEWNATVGLVAFDAPEDEIAILGHHWCLEFLRASFDGELRQVDLAPISEFPGIALN